MPNIMIHEKVGYEISKKIEINSNLYFLGLLAPDTPNLYGFGKKEERWMAHIRRSDLHEWRLSLQNFYQENKNNYPNDFLIGYFIHVLTDIVYDDFFYLKVREEIKRHNPTSNDLHNCMREDMDLYYFKEYEEIKQKLKQEKTEISILNITEDHLQKWKEKQINNPIQENKSLYITEKLIRELIEVVYQELLESSILNR